MELSGLIFVALALVWAVVLIPKALRHHDEAARTRSVADVSDEGRVVTRRPAAAAAAGRGEPAPAERRLPSAPPPPVPSAPSPKAPAATASARAAARRRQILALLVVADVLVGAAAVAGMLQRWAPIVPVTLTVLFLVVARVTVRRERARRERALQRRRRTAQRVVAPLAHHPADTVVVAEPASAVEQAPPLVAEQAVPEQRNAQGLNVVSGLDDTSSIPVVRVDDDRPSGSLWDPLPVTLPTYVTKPRASRSVRTIDLSAPDVSSSGRSSTASALVAEAATAAAAGDEGSAKAVGS